MSMGRKFTVIELDGEHGVIASDLPYVWVKFPEKKIADDAASYWNNELDLSDQYTWTPAPSGGKE